MNEPKLGQIESQIDYFVSRLQSVVEDYRSYQSNAPLYIALGSALVSCISGFIAYRSWRDAHQRHKTDLHEAERRHIRNEWNGILDICVEHPEFMDLSVTNHYDNQKRELALVYDAFCHKAWSLAEFISRSELIGEIEIKSILWWVFSYHRVWLDKNPYLFSSKRFSEIYEEARKKPLAHLRPKMLPINEGKPCRSSSDKYTDLIDWDLVHADYHKWILSPLAPQMVKPDPEKGNMVRNILLTRLLSIADLKKQRILDYGWN